MTRSGDVRSPSPRSSALRSSIHGSRGMLLTVIASTIAGTGGNLAIDHPAVAQVTPANPAPSPEVVRRSSQNTLTFFRSMTLTPGFNPDPFLLSGISGGTIAAATIADRLETETGICSGYVSAQPDYELVLPQEFSYLNLKVSSPNDTMLLVQGPGGTWCNDDGRGVNPKIAGQWLAGTYKIWVGSANPDQYHPYDLLVTEVQ